ncbi:hypothetical protein [Streptomyces millisiae]|uniref:Aromatic ring-opening dioxygenase LigA n=1 Tax=Streptomyces millisiae TaxID=3075542 RepID=A0ABU2LRM5_9ACTN|nr:hypothetical protein [Streptomyces sp. DSM 44918]MDT0320237.1 hypothetical protein [Streptomyces sp. DSM 44918]
MGRNGDSKFHGEPEGWRTGPEWRRRERRWWAGPVAGLVTVVVAVLAVRPELLTDRLSGGDAGPAPAEVLPAETERPTAPPPREALPDRPTLDDPFAGSPAREWADNADGIEMPEPEAVGVISAERMAEALDLAREFLVATNLDPEVIAGEVPEEGLAILDPTADVDDYVDRALSDPSREYDAASLFSRFHADHATLLGDVVKVRGRTEVTEGEDGSATLHLDYTFVYPLVAADGSEEVTRTIVRRTIDLQVLDPERWQITPGTLWPGEWRVDRGNDDCAVTDGFLNPLFDSQLWEQPPPSGEERDPYDRSEEVAESEDCGLVSRI